MWNMAAMMFCVPASSLLSAETSCAFVHSGKWHERVSQARGGMRQTRRLQCNTNVHCVCGEVTTPALWCATGPLIDGRNGGQSCATEPPQVQHVGATCRQPQRGRGREKSSCSPRLTIVCTLACGKMVILPGVSVCCTTRAPFSSIMYVLVVPCTATT